jgi:diadenosine tetraphosphate (Ap4A) HIT family hydrolase
MDCIFCNHDRSILAQTKLSFASLDNFPISNGHALVIPKRHVVSIWDPPQRKIVAYICKISVRRQAASSSMGVYSDKAP